MNTDPTRMGNWKASFGSTCSTVSNRGSNKMIFRWSAFLCALCTVILQAAEVIPPAPSRYFNDYAGIIAQPVAQGLNRKLEDFEKTTSNQIVVAIFPKMQTDSSLDDYTQRIFEAWKPGQKKLNNGALLLVFVQEHKIRIQTGYGLEGALPDITCKRIIDNEITPRFKVRDFNGGMTAGINAMIAATKGEYKGTGKTVKHSQQNAPFPFQFAIILFFGFIYLLSLLFKNRTTQFSSTGCQTSNQGWFSSLIINLIFIFFNNSGRGGGSGGGFGGSDSGGFSGGGDGGGFSGGGGDSGGGGSSGSW